MEDVLTPLPENESLGIFNRILAERFSGSNRDNSPKPKPPPRRSVDQSAVVRKRKPVKKK
jgi:hypothetical protein